MEYKFKEEKSAQSALNEILIAYTELAKEKKADIRGINHSVLDNYLCIETTNSYYIHFRVHENKLMLNYTNIQEIHKREELNAINLAFDIFDGVCTEKTRNEIKRRKQNETNY